MSLKTLSAKSAAALDVSLMSTLGYKLEQLMELAGLSVAQAIYSEYKPVEYPNVVVVCGPGNNGGDGLVAARHLKLFGYPNVSIYWPIIGREPFFQNLKTQLELFNVPIVNDIENPNELVNFKKVLKDSNLIVDAMFGFSFKPPLRAPFNHILKEILTKQQSSSTKIFAVDVPSGWDVDNGPNVESGTNNYMPDALISLTAPKPCSLKLSKNVGHFLGGRFISQDIANDWDFELPKYDGVNQFVKLN